MSVPSGGGTALLDVKNLSVRFRTRDGVVQAVSDLSFTLHRGETLGVVGESGSGKSVTSLAINGALTQDLPTVLGVVLLAACAVALMNLFVDILYAFIDPRVRYA